MQKTIQVTIKQVYGKDTIYPVCETAKMFCKLQGRKTLTADDLNIARVFGATIELIMQGVKVGEL